MNINNNNINIFLQYLHNIIPQSAMLQEYCCKLLRFMGNIKLQKIIFKI